MTGRNPATESIRQRKRVLRQQLQHARSELSRDLHHREAAALARHAATLAGTVCGYVPGWPEPGDERLLTALAARGPLWLPRVPTDGPGPLDWAEFAGMDQLRPARFGLWEPAGLSLGSEAIAEADVVLLPALAVSRTGERLGKGGGYYDRSLALAGQRPWRVAVARNRELLDELPHQAHDLAVHAVLTPEGLVRLTTPDE